VNHDEKQNLTPQPNHYPEHVKILNKIPWEGHHSQGPFHEPYPEELQSSLPD